MEDTTTQEDTMKRTFTPTADQWAKWGARPMTREEIAAEKKSINETRKQHGGHVSK